VVTTRNIVGTNKWQLSDIANGRNNVVRFYEDSSKENQEPYSENRSLGLFYAMFLVIRASRLSHFEPPRKIVPIDKARRHPSGDQTGRGQPQPNGPATNASTFGISSSGMRAFVRKGTWRYPVPGFKPLVTSLPAKNFLFGPVTSITHPTAAVNRGNP
jgi:hypothetical protein